ncbi:MAG: hypothetical protein ABI548_18375 [Polyangiaceae bacterium]
MILGLVARSQGLTSVWLHACPYCTLGATRARGLLQYLGSFAAAVVVVGAIVLAAKYLLSPGEANSDHIKSRVLEERSDSKRVGEP